MTAPLELPDTLEPVETTFSYKGTLYRLTEASEAASIRYRKAILKSISFDESGRPRPNESYPEREKGLVSDCLFTGSQGSPIRVPPEVVDQFPQRVVRKLFKWVQTVSGLGDDQPADTVEAARKQVEGLEASLKEARETLTKLEAGEEANPTSAS